MVKLIVSDLDGTLLTGDKNISPYTLSILEVCRKRGIKFAIATSRSEKSSKRFIDSINPDAAILNGGALLINGKGTSMYKKLLSSEAAGGIIDACIKSNQIGNITVETEKAYYTTFKEPGTFPGSIDYMHGKYYDFQKPLSQEAYKVTVEIYSPKTAKEIEDTFTECKMVSFTGENWYSFTHKETGKMAAIEILARNEKLRVEDIIAFGDDNNDLDMIRGCGTGVAMENGIDEIKKAAKFICGSNSNDGVGKWIEKNILL